MYFKTFIFCAQVCHFAEDGDFYSPETWTAEQEEEALKKCWPKYNSLVHIKINNKKEYFTVGNHLEKKMHLNHSAIINLMTCRDLQIVEL